VSKITLKPSAYTLANVTLLVPETCDLTRDEQRDVLSYLYSVLHVEDHHPDFHDKAMDMSHDLVAPGRETGWDMPERRCMSAAIELPPGDIEHIRLMYRKLGVVLPKSEYDDMLDTAAKGSRHMRQRMLDHVTRKLEEVYPLIIRGKATEEMHRCGPGLR
jgi:hypothetical protein